MSIKKAWAARIYKYAEEHYDSGGWDIIVECCSNEDIIELFDESCTSYLEAFGSVCQYVDLKSEQRKEIESTIF